jgi:hypothetical protein
MLLEFNLDEFPNLSKFIIYTHKATTLHCINLHLQPCMYTTAVHENLYLDSRPHFFSQSTRFTGYLSDCISIINSEPSVSLPAFVMRGIDIIQSLFHLLIDNSNDLMAKGDANRACCLVAGMLNNKNKKRSYSLLNHFLLFLFLLPYSLFYLLHPLR